MKTVFIGLFVGLLFLIIVVLAIKYGSALTTGVVGKIWRGSGTGGDNEKKKSHPFFLTGKFWFRAALLVGVLWATQHFFGFPLSQMNKGRKTAQNSLYQAVWGQPLREINNTRAVDFLRQDSSFDSAGLQRWGYLVPFRHDGTPLILPGGKDPIMEVTIHKWGVDGVSLFAASTPKQGSYTFTWDGMASWGQCHYKANPGAAEGDGDCLWKIIDMESVDLKAAQWAGPKGLLTQAAVRAEAVNRKGTKGVRPLGAMFFTTSGDRPRIAATNTIVYALMEAPRSPNH